MSNKIIIPVIEFPRFSELTRLSEQIKAISETLENSSIAQFTKIATDVAKSHEEIVKNSGILELQRQQRELMLKMAEMTRPAEQMMESIRAAIDTIPRVIFQPYQPPSTSYQQPSIDLPEVVINGKKAELHFDDQVVQLGNRNTQVAKAAIYICRNIGNEIDVAILHIQCHDPDRGKYTSASRNLTMDDRYARGAATLTDLYKKEGFSKIFYLDQYWQSGKRRFTPILKK